jgi:hypothetical protein
VGSPVVQIVVGENLASVFHVFGRLNNLTLKESPPTSASGCRNKNDTQTDSC